MCLELVYTSIQEYRDWILAYYFEYKPMHTYKGVYMPIKKLYVSIFIFITGFSKIKCKLCENKSMYGKMNITIEILHLFR